MSALPLVDCLQLLLLTGLETLSTLLDAATLPTWPAPIPLAVSSRFRNRMGADSRIRCSRASYRAASNGTLAKARASAAA